MDRKKKIIDLISEQGILPHYFHQDADVSIQILKTLYEAGVRVVEYTNHDQHAIKNFLHLRKFADKELPGLQLGVGTIRNKIEATEFINEGANFIICPGVIESVAELADKNDLLWVPGCFTATEICLADDLGAELVNLFPGSFLGPSYLAVMKEAFPNLLFMSTGGPEISEENLNGWFKSGASAVGIGNKLITNKMVESEDYQGIALLAKKTLQMVKGIKNR